MNEFVAGFIGSPSINMIEVELASVDGGLSVTFGDQRLSLDDTVARVIPGSTATSGARCSSAFRPRTSTTRKPRKHSTDEDARIVTTCD